MKHKLLKLLIIAAIGQASPGAAEMLNIQSFIESRVRDIVRTYDPKALVFAQLEQDKTAVALPATPFLIAKADISKDGLPQLKKIDLKVLVAELPLPSEIAQLINLELRKISPSVNLQVGQRVVTEIEAKEKQAQEIVIQQQLQGAPEDRQAEEERRRLRELERELSRKEAEIVARQRDVERAQKSIDWFKSLTPPQLQQQKDQEPKKADEPQAKAEDFVQKLQDNPAIMLALIATAAVAVMLLLLFGLLIVNSRRGASTLKQSIEGLAEAFQAGGSKGSRSDSKGKKDDSPQVIAAGGEGGKEKADFNSLSVESLVALISDAYWSHKDGYAAYVWRRLNFEKKQELLQEEPSLVDYSKHLVDQKEEHGTYEQDPYYLKPFKISHLSTADLTELVRKDKGLYNKLPLMRKEALEASVTERIDWMRSAPGEIEQETDLTTVAQSIPRTFTPKMELKLQSVEEEEQLLAMDLSPDYQKLIPSLRWLAKSPIDKVAELLAQFSVPQLAEGWVGTPIDLNHLASLLPEKKRALLEEYLLRTPARRDSEVHEELV